MSNFELWVLGILENIPEFDFAIPDFVYQFLKDLVTLIDCFIVFEDFVPILSASVFISSISLSIALFDYIRSFKK